MLLALPLFPAFFIYPWQDVEEPVDCDHHAQ